MGWFLPFVLVSTVGTAGLAWLDHEYYDGRVRKAVINEGVDMAAGAGEDVASAVFNQVTEGDGLSGLWKNVKENWWWLAGVGTGLYFGGDGMFGKLVFAAAATTIAFLVDKYLFKSAFNDAADISRNNPGMDPTGALVLQSDAFVGQLGLETAGGPALGEDEPELANE